MTSLLIPLVKYLWQRVKYLTGRAQLNDDLDNDEDADEDGNEDNDKDNEDDNEDNDKDDKNDDDQLIRQCLIVSSVCAHDDLMGQCLKLKGHKSQT